MDEVNRKANIKKHLRNRSFKMRSNSVVSQRVPERVRMTEEFIIKNARDKVAGHDKLGKELEMNMLHPEHHKEPSQMSHMTSEAKACMNSDMTSTRRSMRSDAFEVPQGAIGPKKHHRALSFIHKLRMDAFDKRANDPMNVKPYLPMLISDEREVIMEHLDASRKQVDGTLKPQPNQ